MPISNYLQKKLIDHIYLSVTYTPPATIYLALYTVAPTAAGGGTAVSGGSYARKVIAFNPADAVTLIAVSNIAVDFPSMPACTIVAAGLFDSLTSGNLLHFETLPAPYVVSAGENLTVSIGDVGISIGQAA